ncbi:transmembrane protein 272-like [Boleophthalmus pectinirostris]|uniref:transmembrane protein 272-like n=1 Tax=Boleophthalmus pectinirostris TaxID=150288 RepID=UPI00242F89B5|nr:transmembrane protein 272-like [Boleophthalmus pectinirostris]
MSVLIDRVKKTPRPPLPIMLCSKVVVCILPVAQIAIGAAYLDECPKEHYIPIYLVVIGVCGLILAILACLPCAQDSPDGTTSPLHRLCTAWNSLLSAFVSCWFIAGNVWIYRIYEPNYVKNATIIDTYCNKTLYLFAFWTTTLAYILLGAILVGGCCVLCCFCLCGRADPDD